MSLHTHSSARPLPAAIPARLAWARRASLGVLVLLVAEYGIGMYVNLYITVPRSDHGHSVATAIADGPAVLSLHIVVGLLLALGSIGVLAQAVRAGHAAVITASALGLFAIGFAAVIGASFTSSGDPADSMGMAVLTGAGLLCYAANLYLLRPAPTAAPGGGS